MPHPLIKQKIIARLINGEPGRKSSQTAERHIQTVPELSHPRRGQRSSDSEREIQTRTMPGWRRGRPPNGPPAACHRCHRAPPPQLRLHRNKQTEVISRIRWRRADYRNHRNASDFTRPIIVTTEASTPHQRLPPPNLPTHPPVPLTGLTSKIDALKRGTTSTRRQRPTLGSGVSPGVVPRREKESIPSTPSGRSRLQEGHGVHGRRRHRLQPWPEIGFYPALEILWSTANPSAHLRTYPRCTSTHQPPRQPNLASPSPQQDGMPRRSPLLRPG